MPGKPAREIPSLQAKAGAKRPAIQRNLLEWFRQNARDLPFRMTKDPYRIWLAEVLLQQTRMESGVRYYNRFLKALPNVRALAGAGEARVLKLWEGLGYYHRARNLHQAAKRIVSEYDGVFPRTAKAWARLPGVGPYTAGAVSSIVFGEPVPALDGNGKRVLARLFCVRQPIDKASTNHALWALAGWLVPGEYPGDFNQSLMELGAQVCVPLHPRCEQCPLKRQCEARLHGEERAIPQRTRKKSVPHRTVAAAAILQKDRYLMGRRRGGGMLPGLWEFPGGTVKPGESRSQALERIMRHTTGLRIHVGRKIASIQHAYSHFRITLCLYECSSRGGSAHSGHYDKLAWIGRSAFGRYALPASDRKLLAFL
ncbi:MAG: A/G-specific adenine glycosylase [Planctomycetota bacterium]